MNFAINATKRKITLARERSMLPNEEITLNVQLSPLALKLRTMRLQKGFSVNQVALITKITEEDIIAFECDKKVPSSKEQETLFSFYS